MIKPPTISQKKYFVAWVLFNIALLGLFFFFLGKEIEKEMQGSRAGRIIWGPSQIPLTDFCTPRPREIGDRATPEEMAVYYATHTR